MTKDIITDDFNDIMKKYDPSNNKTRNILSKFEKVKIIGLRSEQLQRGAQPYIKLTPNQPFIPRDVAMQELKEHKLPFMLRRQLPNGTIEYFRLDDMVVL